MICKKTVFFFVIIFWSNISFGQVKIPPKQTQTKTTPAKQTTTKPAETKPTYTGPVHTLKVMSNVACKFYVDGEYKATITEGSIERIGLKLGEYQLKAVSTENSADVFRQILKIEKTGIEKFYEVDLKTIAEERERREYAEQSISEGKAAEEKAAREKAATEQSAIQKANAEKAAREKTAAQQLLAEKNAAEKARQENASKEQTEAQRLAAEKAALEKAERLKAEAERLAIEKAAQEKAAREKAEAARLAAEKVAAEKAEAQRLVAEKAAAEHAAREKEEDERLAIERAEREKAEEEARKIAEQKALEFSLNGFTVTDDFSDNKNDWLLENYNNKRMIIADGKFVAEGYLDNFSYKNLLNFPVNLSKDFEMEVNIRWIQGEEKNGFGIDFASNEATKSYYTFIIASIGYYSIIYHKNGTWEDIVKWTDSKYINRGNEVNKLKVEKQDDYLLFYANGELLEKIDWNGGFGSDFGFRIFDKQLVEYDDFLLKGIKNQ